MGLSSSQARLLNLTSRMHQIEYNAARLEAMKLQMANESKRVYEDYLDALDKTKIQKKTINADGSLTYVDIVSYDDFLKAGYALVVHGTKDGKANVTDATETSPGTIVENAAGTVATTANETICTSKFQLAYAVSQIYKDENSKNLNILSALKSTTDFKTLLQNLINSGDVTIVQGSRTAMDGYSATTIGTGTDAMTMYFPTTANTNAFSYAETSVSTNTGLQEVTDEIELKKAEAKYEADMKRIDLKDRKYDSDLAALDSERNAIKQEMETLKTVAKDNVERTFKLFS